MSCARLYDALTDHACGAPLETSAAAHLAICPICRKLLEEERRIVTGIQDELEQALRVSPSPGFSARVTAQLPRSRRVGVREGCRTAMGLAATLALAAYLGSSDTAPHPPPAGAMRVAIASEPGASGAGESHPGRRRDAALQPSGNQGKGADEVALASLRTSRERARPAAQGRTDRLVPRTQLEAIARVRELALSGALEEALLPAEAPQPSPPAELVILPLTVQEIVIPDVTQPGLEAATEIE